MVLCQEIGLVEKALAVDAGPQCSAAAAEGETAASANDDGSGGGATTAAAGERDVNLGALRDIAAKVSVAEKSDMDLVAPWRAHAERLLRQYVRLVVAPTTEAGFYEEVKSSPLGQARGEASGLTMPRYDVKMGGEAITNPHLRTCPFQEEPYKRMVSGVLRGRGDTMAAPSGSGGEASTENVGIQAGDLVAIIDAGRAGEREGLGRSLEGGRRRPRPEGRARG